MLFLLGHLLPMNKGLRFFKETVVLRRRVIQDNRYDEGLTLETSAFKLYAVAIFFFVPHS